ncbi:MAG TPA: hypothetical protein EYQ08_07235 [Planctomycetes bacterium]|nr:hypothetical protein [Planctomycetota bacterium]
MKAIATILALLVVATGGFAYKTSEALKASNQKLDRLQIKFQVLSERFDEREESLASIGLDSIQVPSADPVTGEIKVPEGLVSAVAMQIAQNSSALGAIAKEISSPTPVSDGPPLESNQLDQQVRDTIAAVQDEERIQREQRMQDRMQDRAAERANQMAEDLGLSGTRADEFTALLVDHSAYRMQLMMEAREMDLSRGDIRSFFDQTRSEQNIAVEQILTPTQYADYLALPQDNFGGGRWRGGFGGSSNGNSNNGNGNNGNSNNGNGNNGNSNNGNGNNGNNGGGNSGGGRSGGF